MQGASNNASGLAGRRLKGRGGGRASAALPLRDDVPASPPPRALSSGWAFGPSSRKPHARGIS